MVALGSAYEAFGVRTTGCLHFHSKESTFKEDFSTSVKIEYDFGAHCLVNFQPLLFLSALKEALERSGHGGQPRQ